jgi:hypothetical protein
MLPLFICYSLLFVICFANILSFVGYLCGTQANKRKREGAKQAKAEDFVLGSSSSKVDAPAAKKQKKEDNNNNNGDTPTKKNKKKMLDL